LENRTQLEIFAIGQEFNTHTHRHTHSGVRAALPLPASLPGVGYYGKSISEKKRNKQQIHKRASARGRDGKERRGESGESSLSLHCNQETAGATTIIYLVFLLDFFQESVSEREHSK